MNKTDAIFWRQFGTILVILTISIILIYFVGNHIGNAAFYTAEHRSSAINERIAPFGHAEVGDPLQQTAAATSTTPTAPAAAAASTASAGAGTTLSGKAVYNQVCTACHSTGAAGAPKLSDTAVWTSRLAEGGVAGLVSAAINGEGLMPAKGGASHLSDAEIRSAVMYMLEEMNLSAP